MNRTGALSLLLLMLPCQAFAQIIMLEGKVGDKDAIANELVNFR